MKIPNIQECIEESEKLILKESSKYQEIMNIPTLRHRELYNQMKGSWNSFLGVVGSFGPSLEAILRGSKNIVAFDNNPLNILHSYLMIAAILKLEYEDFLKFISYNKEENYYGKYYFEMIKEELPSNVKYYWDYIIRKYSNNPSFINLFFNQYMFDEECIKEMIEELSNRNEYFKKEGYYQLKKKLKMVKIRFLLESFEKIPKAIAQQKFDKIYLSCLNLYIYDVYFEVVKEFCEFLKPNGVMECAYLYHDYIARDMAYVDSNISDISMKKIKIKYTKYSDFSYDLAYLYQQQ